MKRELRWPIVVALLVAAVLAGPSLVRGTIGWVQTQLGDETTNAGSASPAEEQAPTPRADPARVGNHAAKS